MAVYIHMTIFIFRPFDTVIILFISIDCIDLHTMSPMPLCVRDSTIVLNSLLLKASSVSSKAAIVCLRSNNFYITLRAGQLLLNDPLCTAKYLASPPAALFDAVETEFAGISRRFQVVDETWIRQSDTEKGEDYSIGWKDDGHCFLGRYIRCNLHLEKSKMVTNLYYDEILGRFDAVL